MGNQYRRLLFDASNLVHRMRHAYADLAANDGRPTGVLYGTLRSLWYYVKDYDPDVVVFVWDGPRDSVWRYKLFPDYKKARRDRDAESTPEEQFSKEQFYAIQIPETQFALAQLGVPQIMADSLEADDLIGYLSKDPDADDILMSTDQDYYQLVARDRCRVCNPQTERLYYEASDGTLRMSSEHDDLVAPSPRTALMQKAICGDSSDSIPGVIGVGPKRAAQIMDAPIYSLESPLEYWHRVVEPKLGGKAKYITALKAAGMVTLDRNLTLMNLDGVAERFEGASSIDTAYKEAFLRDAPWLAAGLEDSDPNAFVNFFRARDFQFAYEPPLWREWIVGYRSLRDRMRAVVRNTDGYLPQEEVLP